MFESSEMANDKISDVDILEGKAAPEIAKKRARCDFSSDLVSEVGSESSVASNVPYIQQVIFMEKIRKMKSEKLTKMVMRIQDLCPNALVDASEENFLIKFYKIDKDSFQEL